MTTRLLGVITASVAAWFVANIHRIEKAEEKSEATLDEVMAELRRLHARLDAIDSAAQPD